MCDVLKDNNLIRTMPRQVVLKIIQESQMPMSAQAIYEKAILIIDVNLSTIYRALNTLSGSGLVIKQVRLDGVAYYQENAHDHKHIITCSECKSETSIDICVLDKALNSMTKQTGFKLTGHSVDLQGICPDCQC